MRRRTLLRSAVVAGATGTLGALAGCTDGGGTPTPSGTRTVQVYDDEEHGEILVGPLQSALYMFDQDSKGAGESACTGDCLNDWNPLNFEDTTKGQDVTAEVTSFQREDGNYQVAVAGWPVYNYGMDVQEGDTNGHKTKTYGGRWYLLAPDGSRLE